MAGKTAQRQRLKVNPQDPCGSHQLIPVSCPLNSTQVSWHTCKYIQIKIFFYILIWTKSKNSVGSIWLEYMVELNSFSPPRITHTFSHSSSWGSWTWGSHQLTWSVSASPNEMHWVQTLSRLPISAGLLSQSSSRSRLWLFLFFPIKYKRT